MRNKELFFELNSTGKKVSMKKYREHPVDYILFTEIISELKNINSSNLDFFKDFYKKYTDDIFVKTILKKPSEYSKYFWNLECLELNINSATDDYWLQRGWLNEDINKKRKERYATGTVEFQKKKYNLSDKEAGQKLNKRQAIIKDKRKETYRKYLEKDPSYFKKKCGYSVEHFINKGYTNKKALELSKKSSLNVSEKNKIWAKTQREYNLNYWNSRLETQLKYWLAKGYSEKEAKEKLKERQTTFSKEKLIKKYGEQEGFKKWSERQEKWKAKVFNDKQWLGGGVSKISNELFEKIIKSANLDVKDCLYGVKNEKYISNKDLHYKFDFTYLPTKKIIEFHGDYWHCNPDLYEANYYHKIKKMQAKEIWDYDKEKIELAKSYGYSVLVVWEADYYKNPEETANKCKHFIKN